MKALLNLFILQLGPKQTALGLILGSISWLYGDLAIGLGILVFITFADFITGILKAGRNGEVESAKISRTAYKIAAYAVLIAILHVFFKHLIPMIPGLEPDTSFFPPVILNIFNIVPHLAIAILAVGEMISNIENLAEGGYIPEATAKWLGKILSRVGDSIQKKQDQTIEGFKANEIIVDEHQINTGTGVSDTDGEN